MRFRRLVFIAFCLFFAMNTAGYAKSGKEYIAEIETLLIQGKVDLADKQAKEFEKKYRKGNRDYFNAFWDEYGRYKDRIKALKKIGQFIDENQDDLSKIHAGSNAIYKEHCNSRTQYECKIYYNTFQFGLKTRGIFGNKIFDHYKAKTVALIKRLEKFTADTKKYHKDKVAAEQKAWEDQQKAENEKRALEGKKQREEWERKQREKQAATDEQRRKEQDAKAARVNVQTSELNDIAAQNGYAGYAGLNVVQIMAKVQKEGGLENYVNKLIGSIDERKSDYRWYNKVKLIQVLDDALLYSFHEKNTDFTIMVEKENGKIYVENQRLTKQFYVFKKMVTYKTTVGSTKTVPYFEKAMIE